MFVLGRGDGQYYDVPITLVYNLSVILISDFFTVECEDHSAQNASTKKRSFYPKLPYASIHYNPTIQQRLAKVKRRDDDFNVLILGLDSISRLQFERMLPQTYQYITQDMNGTILQGLYNEDERARLYTLWKSGAAKEPSRWMISFLGYNIVGDGTPQQLIPMLTGLTEMELPSTLSRDLNSSFVDVYPFIWNQFREQDYVTGYAEDRTEYGIWTLRLKGFANNPTDHYFLPFYRMSSTKSLLYRNDAHCIRNQTSFELFLSYIEQFWSSYPLNKKFFFAFFKQFTHDGYTAGSLLDSGLLNFFRNFHQINNGQPTIIVLMTDHGARFSLARQTPQGKLEERLPLMSWIFPQSFREKYPQAIENFQRNIPRLTTPFDIHATLVSLLDMQKLNINLPSRRKQRNISLFQSISTQRTCDDINLEAHWCSCLQWKTISINDTRIEQATKKIIEHINQHLLLVEENLCYELTLRLISQAQMYQPNQALLTFSKSADLDGRVAEYEDKTSDIVFFQITFQTSPNHAFYEATVEYSKTLGGYAIDLNHVSRLNAYRSSAKCIEKDYAHLRKFCQCIK